MEASRAALAHARATLPAPPKLPADAYYDVGDMTRALLGDGLDGVCQTRDNRVLVASEAEFPAGPQRSVEWWFSAGCRGDDEYRLWHPDDHVAGTWTDG